MLLWGRLLIGCECHEVAMMTNLFQEWILDVAKHMCTYQLLTLPISVMRTVWLVNFLHSGFTTLLHGIHPLFASIKLIGNKASH
jgi:hypothetical protein